MAFFKKKIVPRATYRLQFNKNFTLKDAIKLVPYLDDLGISHIYSSPLLKAVPGSMHGYDVCDHSQINPEIGTEEDLKMLSAELKKRGMGIILDIVPNHMGINTPDNKWWWDVLKRGHKSKYAGYFDIDWAAQGDKVALPVLQESIVDSVNNKKLLITENNGEPVAEYFGMYFPFQQSVPKNINKSDILQLLSKQNYILVPKEDDTRLNYRRFFNISSLATIKQENISVYRDAHQLVKKWYGQGFIEGLRVDHPDGLGDPHEYFKRLEKDFKKCWIVAEKIISNNETLNEDWHIDGTTGYDFINELNKFNNSEMTKQNVQEAYEKFTESRVDIEKYGIEQKIKIIKKNFKSEVYRLVGSISDKAKDKINLSEDTIKVCIILISACLPVYRTYFRPGKIWGLEFNLWLVEKTFDIAKKFSPSRSKELDKLRGFLFPSSNYLQEKKFIYMWQQFTPAVTAKGVEDTLFYNYNRCLSDNEVGGDLECGFMTTHSIHNLLTTRFNKMFNSLLTLDTHDTKRSFDLRLRIKNALEQRQSWDLLCKECVEQLNKTDLLSIVGKNFAYHMFQIVVGSWHVDPQRVEQYLIKAARESEQNTSWDDIDIKYEKNVINVYRKLIKSPKISNLIEKQATDNKDLILNTLLLNIFLQLTLPGIPDIYQGSEVVNILLVDPDNRRPVNFNIRKKMLKEVAELSFYQVWQNFDIGHCKLWLIQKLLNLKKQKPELFDKKAVYKPIYASGEKADSIISYARGNKMVVVASRVQSKVADGWSDTKIFLPNGHWENFLNCDNSKKYQKEVSLQELLDKMPIALLIRR